MERYSDHPLAKNEIKQLKMRRNIDPEDIISSLLINGDERELMKRVAKGDKTSLFQLVMRHLPSIISFAAQKRDEEDAVTMAEMMDLVTGSFIETAEFNAANGVYEVEGWYRRANRAANDLIAAKDVKYHRINYTTRRIEFLNQLNRFLKIKELEIIEKIKAYGEMLQQRWKDTPSSGSDYEIFAEVSFFTTKSNGNSIHTYYNDFQYNADGKLDPGFLLSKEDWREGYMPELDEPYCYLLHDLIDHSRIGNQLFHISYIWADVKLWDQHCQGFNTRKKYIK